MTQTYQPRYSKGDRIGGRYLVHQALLGGMGEVYLCLDEEEFVPLSLKTFQGSDLRMKALFEGEVANWIALEKHPNIVRLFIMKTLDNVPFMVLEWIASDESKGTDLRSWLRHGALPLELALKFTIDIVRGLQHANEKSPGIVHRDLKPDNVLVNQSRQAKITDFGLATVVQQADLNMRKGDIGEGQWGQSMRVGHVVGTPAYMSPEQWRGELDLDFRTDIYAVGCILYELLTGSIPFIGRTISELRTQHIEASWPNFNADFPAELKPILAGCLAKDRAARYETLDLLFSDLKQVLERQSGEPLADIEVHKFTARDYNNRGITYGELGQHERAIQDLDEAIRLDPNFAMAYSNRGKSYADLGQHQRAIQDYDEAIRLDPNFAMAYSNRGKSYADLGQHQRAIQDYDEAIRLDPNFAGAYSNRGSSYGSLGQHERAIQDLDEAIRLDPNFAGAYYNRGLTYGELGQHERAIQDYDGVIRLDPNYAPAYTNRGARYGSLGQHERAIQDFDEAIRLDPNDAPAYYNRGTSYDSVGQHERAIRDYDEAIRLDPNDATAYSNRGHSYGVLGQHEQAMQDLDEAILLNLKYAMAYYNRGNRYGSLGQHKRAIQDYDEAIRLDPNFAMAYYNRGSSYGYLGQHRQALQDFDEAIRLDPNDAPAYFSKGAALANTGRLQESLPLFEKAHSLGDEQAAGAIQQVRHMLGHAPAPLHQVKANDPQAAFEAFQQANTPAAMQQSVQQFPVLAQMIAGIEQIINEQIPADAKPAFEQRLVWLKQIVQVTQPFANEQEQALRQLLALYQEHGETALKQILAQQGMPAEQIEEIITVVKQIIAGE